VKNFGTQKNDEEVEKNLGLSITMRKGRKMKPYKYPEYGISVTNSNRLAQY
jgi:hypothetical protein